MTEFKRKLLFLIAGRVVLVTLVLGAGILVIPQESAFSHFLQPFVVVVYLLSALYFVLWKYSERLETLFNIQFAFDLLLLSILIYFSGGIHSLFAPLYVLIIVYSGLLADRQGGVLALSLSIISYTGIVHLHYLGLLPLEDDSADYRNVIYRVALNVLGFVAVALLGIFLSERLRRASRELGVTKGSLAALAALHENIVNSIRSGLVTLDLRGVITSVNRSAQEICGYHQNELLARPLSRFFPEPVFDRVLKSDFQSTSRPLRLECWIKGKSGDSIFLGMSCSPLLSQQKEKIGYILSIQDLTEIKQLEEEIQFREKMSAVGQMAAGLAHEIRNPLGSISGSIQLLRSELDLTDENRRLLEIALKESERLNKIVQDFLIYASGSQPISVEPVDLLPLVQETVALFQNNPDLMENHTIEISPSQDSVVCLGNADQLRQVVWNILHNSIRAMPEGGKLSIELHNEEGRTLMSFRDEGMGMSLEQKKRLFQPFQSGFRKGVGLGMAIVYQIIQQHQGRIEVHSRKGKGTIVDIWLPAARPATLYSAGSPASLSDVAESGRRA